MASPIVSICCTTFNHENHIKDAIEGFLTQKTTFTFEIIVHDDASTDNTASIIRHYEKQYPDLFKCIYQTENQWSKGIKPSPTFIWPKAKGKYLALCEGDDYWTDPLKLQKQVNFLESNKEYGLVHTDSDLLHEINNKLEKSLHLKNNIKIPNGYIYDDLLIRNFIKTLTVVFRKDLLPENLFDFNVGDYPLWLKISLDSKIGYISNSTSVYRKRINSMSNFTDMRREYEFKKGTHRIKQYFIDTYGCNSNTKKIVDKDFNELSFEYAYKLKDYKLAVKQYNNIEDNLKKRFDYKLKLMAAKSNPVWYFSKIYFRIVNKLISTVQK